jgi:hypothetical protein
VLIGAKINIMPLHITVDQKGAANGVAELGADSKVPVAQLPSFTTLEQRAGTVLNAAFTGNPKKATVTFTTPFADANYSPALSCSTINGAQFAPIIESITASSFVINVGVNNINNLTAVYWTATKHGNS